MAIGTTSIRESPQPPEEPARTPASGAANSARRFRWPWRRRDSRERPPARFDYRIRTLLHLIDTEILDEITGGWLRSLADVGRLDGLLAAIAIDGKWLRGVLDGQVKLFAAILHEKKAVIAQHRIPDETTETTQVKALLEDVDLDGAVVTADAVNRYETQISADFGDPVGQRGEERRIYAPAESARPSPEMSWVSGRGT
jgi:hypothetical protein